MARKRLRSGSIAQILDFVHDIYCHQNAEVLSSHLLSALSRIIPADVHSYNEVNPAQQSVTYKIIPNDFKEVPDSKAILCQYLDQHPFVQHAAATGDGSPRTFSDFVPLQRFKRTDLYQEFYGPMRIPHNLFVEVHDKDPSGKTITLGMHRGGREFRESDRSILTILRPHIRQAIANARLITHLEAECSSLHHVLSGASISALILTSENTILWSMPQATMFLEQVPGWDPQRPDQLPPVVLNWVLKSEHTFGSFSEIPASFLPLEVVRGARLVRMRLLRNGTHRTIVIEKISAPIMAEQLASLGLSKRESEVLAWVGQGKTNEEIGRILGCSHRTVQKHLERVYIKLGVENRTAAAMVATEAARTAGTHHV